MKIMRIHAKALVRCFEILCKILVPLLFVLNAVTWFCGDKLMDSTYGLNIEQFSMHYRFFLFCACSVGTMFAAWHLIVLSQIAQLFQRDEFFSLATVTRFVELKKISVYGGIYNMVYISCFYSIYMSHVPWYVLLLSGLGAGVWYFFLFLLWSVLAILVAKASNLQKDHDLTV